MSPPTSTALSTVRSAITTDTTPISTLLRTPAQLSVRNKILPIISADPVFSKSQHAFRNHAESLLHALKLSHHLLVLRDRHGWTREEFLAGLALNDENLPISLHENAFTTVIESQGSDAQRALWIPKCEAYTVVGCYAQTELAHGSNVQGLETLARFSPDTDEFTIFSPRLESTKWWIGGMGVLANHALVQAILELPGPSGTWISKGPHLFIVPIRSTPAHLPLPGVTVGDIGPKAYAGFRFMDNGYLHLDSVRIPRANMLNRFATLSADGTYTPAPHSKLSYGSMVALRAYIPLNMGWTLARGVTIAIRYCLHRRQFTSAASPEQEQQVLLYTSTTHRLYPLLATAYAYIFAGQRLGDLYTTMMAQLAKGNTALLAETHTLSTALKAASTWTCIPGLEEARKSMGGHGYSHLSGVGSLFAHNTPAQTFEGDNFVISQQISRALVKTHSILSKHPNAPLPESMKYLKTPPRAVAVHDWTSKQTHASLLEARANYLVRTFPASGDSSWQASALARAHAEVYTVAAFAAHAHTHPILGKLYTLFAQSTLLAAAAELVEAGVLDGAGVRALREAQAEAVRVLELGEVVAGTDAFGFVEWELPGVLGGEKEVYGEMWKEVRGSDVSRGERAEELRVAARKVVGHEAARGKL